MLYSRDSNSEKDLGEELDFNCVTRLHKFHNLGICMGDLEVEFEDYAKYFEIYIGDYTTSFEEFVIHEIVLLADTEAYEYNVETDPLDIMEEIYDNYIPDLDRF